MSSFVFYLLVIIDSLKSFIYGLANFGVGIVIIYVIVCLFSIIDLDMNKNSKYWENCKKYFKKILFVGFFTIFLFFANSVIPTTKQMAAIYLIPQIVNNEKIQSIGKNSLGILEKYTEKYLEDLAKSLENKKVKENKNEG